MGTKYVISSLSWRLLLSYCYHHPFFIKPKRKFSTILERRKLVILFVLSQYGVPLTASKSASGKSSILNSNLKKHDFDLLRKLMKTV